MNLFTQVETTPGHVFGLALENVQLNFIFSKYVQTSVDLVLSSLAAAPKWVKVKREEVK